MLHLKTTDSAGHCPQVPQWELWEEDTALQIHPPGLQCVGKPQGPPHGLGSPVSYHFHPGMAGGTDKKKTIAQESTHSSAWSSREKKNSFSRQPLRQGHKGLREILHWVTNFRKNSAEEIPQEK